MLDSRLFNQESLSGNFADEDSYKPVFHGSTAAAAIYKARGNITEGNDESFGGGTSEGIGKALDIHFFLDATKFPISFLLALDPVCHI